jgi:cell division protein FtsW (lipid II flippase)
MLKNILTGRLLFTRFFMLAAAFALTAVGVAVIYATGHPAPLDSEPAPITAEKPEDAPADAKTPEPENQAAEVILPDEEPAHKLALNWRKQVLYFLFGLAGFLVVNIIGYRRLGPISYGLYAVILILLAVLLLDMVIDIPFVPYRENRARRWIEVAIAGKTIFQIQPSEFCKIAYVLALAYYLRYRKNFRHLLGLIGPFALTLLAMVLILLEPDLGTVILMMPILFAMLFAAGAKGRHLLLIIGLALATSPILWMSMHDYQRMRISSLVLQSPRIRTLARKHPPLARILVGRPERLYNWKEGGGYQLLQSKQAIASGSLSGYGFAKGPYIQDDFFFLPDKHNDFIFAVIAHQFGFLGCLGVIFLYAIIVAAGMEIALRNTDPFGRLVAVGITTMFAIQVLVNISMTLGLMPITGLTLPFVSYGGSSLLTSFLGVGLLNSIGRWRPFSVAKKPFEFKSENP